MNEKNYTEGHCREHAKPGGCQLHNLHCGYPDCDRRPIARASAATQAVPAFVDEHGRHYDEQAELVLPPVALPALTDEWLDEAMRLIVEFGRSMKYLWQGESYIRDADSKLDAVRAHLSNVIAASAAPAPEQPNADAEQDHLAGNRNPAVCGVDAAASFYHSVLHLIVAVEDRFGLEKARELAREALAHMPAVPTAPVQPTDDAAALDGSHYLGRYATADDGVTVTTSENTKTPTTDDAAARLRAFAQDVMAYWPAGSDVDGCELQDAAVKHGLLELKSPAPTEPCREGCACAEYYGPEDWIGGVQCFRKTALLTGDAALSAVPPTVKE